MTDNEIIKANTEFNDDEIVEDLKKWISMSKYISEPVFVQHILLQRILDLINRLKAENDDLFYKLTGVMWSVDKWLDGDELKQDEVNRAITMREKTLQIVEELQRNYDAREGVVNTYDKELKRRKAEIERLEQIIKDSHSICEDCKEKYAEEFEDAKAEARKEFAERLKEIGHKRLWICGITEADIDNLLKEMEGEIVENQKWKNG